MATRKPIEAEDPAVSMAIASSLMTIHRGYRVAVDRAVSHIGVSLTLGMPLVMIGRCGGNVRPGILAERLGIASPSLVRTLDQLEAAGLIERNDDASDRRAKTVHLTRAGERAWERIEAALLALRTSLFDGVAREDADACLRVLRLLEERLGRTPPDVVDPPIRKAKRRP